MAKFNRIVIAKKDILKERSISELMLVKQHLSPHFLFNSLNNIYSLVHSNDPRAKDTILMMSNIMRYILNDCSDSKISILRELEYVSSFVELNKLRLPNPYCVKLSINVENAKAEVVPLIFIPFIENAFKHGDFSDINNPVTFSFDILEDYIIFTSFNSYKLKNKDLSSGIGLKHTISRLELLYPSQHEITISDDKKNYLVKLIIGL